MKFVLVSLSALLFMACSGGGSGGGGTTTYKYQVSGTAPFSVDQTAPMAVGTAFVLKWNETTAGVISGIYTAGGETKSVTGSITGGTRQINLAVNPPQSGVSTIRIELPAGDLSGTVSGTIKTLDANGTQLSSSAISLEGSTNSGGGTTVTMPTITCPITASAMVLSPGNFLTLTVSGQPDIYLCIKASNSFTILGDSSSADGTYSYSVPNVSGSLANLTATWSSQSNKVLAALCYTSSGGGNFNANILEDGETASVSGTFTLQSSNMSCN